MHKIHKPDTCNTVELKNFTNSYSSIEDFVLYSTFADNQHLFQSTKKISTEFYSSLFSRRAVALRSRLSHRPETFAISPPKFKKN
jgi:hypothetical protein